MQAKKIGHTAMILALNIATLVFLFGPLGVSPAVARTPARSASLPPGQADVINYSIGSMYPAQVELRDLSGTVIGAGEHEGMFLCVFDNCSQKSRLAVTGTLVSDVEFEYKFSDLVVRDPLAGLAVLSGRGKISSQGRTEHFQFTAAIQDNFDGTLTVSYVASRPEASFLIQAPGKMEF